MPTPPPIHRGFLFEWAEVLLGILRGLEARNTNGPRLASISDLILRARAELANLKDAGKVWDDEESIKVKAALDAIAAEMDLRPVAQPASASRRPPAALMTRSPGEPAIAAKICHFRR